MVKCFLPVILLTLASCQNNVIGRAPTRNEFDPAGGRPAPAAVTADLKAAEEMLAESAKRMKEGYPIYPGDELRFAVMGHADLTFEARVPSEGSINYPLIGKVALSGRTLEEARREIKEKLEKDYLVMAEVTILVKEYARKRVYVMGAVAHPLDYEVPSGRFVTLQQAVAQAGGFLEDAARHGIVIFRAKSPGSPERLAIPVPLDQDPLVMPDDLIVVPSREKIFVLGQVAHPGAFPADTDKGLTATQAVSLAGGFTRVANDSNVRLIRRVKDGARRTFVLDLARVLAGHADEDVPLQPGDLLFVPESIF